MNSLNFGIPVTLIAEAVFSRCLSSLKEERILGNKLISLKTEFNEFSTFTNEQKVSLINDIKYVYF